MLHTRALTLCAGLAFACPSLASTLCPGNAGEALPPPPEMSALAARLAEHEPACGNDPGFLAYRGAILLQLGQTESAAALLERALMLAPDLAGAQADYARALAMLGDRQAARHLIDNLLTRADLPVGLREQLHGWQSASTRPPGTSSWQLSGKATLRAGHDTNLNSAPSRSNLDLTLPDGPITLPLAQGSRSQGGSAVLAEATLQAGRDIAAGGRLELLADLRRRHAWGAEGNDYQQIETLGIITLPTTNMSAKGAVAVYQVSLGASALEYGGESLFQAQRFGLAHVHQKGACLVGASLEGENRHYPTADHLDGRFYGLGGSLRCSLGINRISLLGRYGEDSASHSERPGGNQQRWDLRLSWQRPLAGGEFEAEINLSRQRDKTGYSELLEHGAARRLTRLGLRAEWAWTLAKHIDGLISIETSRQDSNIGLFEVSGTALWLGGRWRWGGQ